MVVNVSVEAGAGDNVSGWAWSKMDDSATPAIDEGQIGWGSFNSTNCDFNGNGITDTRNYPQCLVGATSTNYGVTINSNGNFAGYAWSENIGWISFDPAAPYPASPNYAACLDLPGFAQARNGRGHY